MFNVSDGFEVLIKKINLSWIRRVRAQGTHPARRLRLLPAFWLPPSEFVTEYRVLFCAYAFYI